MSITIGIIREGKTPPDARTPLTPHQCAQLKLQYGINVLIQPSPVRCYTDTEYQQANILLSEDLSTCDFLLGVKEVPINQLIAKKTYCFFSHTIKEQAHNRPLLQSILRNHITLLDYELMVNSQNKRVIAFGFFAGMVGAHNALYAYGARTQSYQLPRLYTLENYEKVLPFYNAIQWPSLKIIITGTGRVGQGAQKVLLDMGLQQVTPHSFIQETFNQPVFTVLKTEDYVRPLSGTIFEKQKYFLNPTDYTIDFSSFYQQADIFINCIYWDNRAPAFFTPEEMASKDFNLQVIADVTCDIAPLSSIPSTLRASTIPDPIYGYDPLTGKETGPFLEKSIDIMAIDNLPGELPRDASAAFGNQILTHLIPALLHPSDNEMLRKATIASQGKINPAYPHLIRFTQEPTDLS